jgi:hypothetical protein
MVAAGEKNDRREESAAEAPADAPAPHLTLVNPAAFTPRSTSPGSAPPMTGEGWRSFVDFALEKGRALTGGEPVPSALLMPGAALGRPERVPCKNLTPGVIVDLDLGDAVFSPKDDTQSTWGLADSLARLRDAGVVVMWVSGADANSVAEIGAALRTSGLDPAGKDPLLLVRNPEERKQVMRTEANQVSCVIAIAGDRRGDFDELFDYLRNPDFALELDALLGDGWFIVPPPLSKAWTPAN